jgi:hypothetical protein
MSLTPQQKQTIDIMLEEKMDLREKREHNRKEVKRLKAMLKTCSYSDRPELEKSIDFGETLVKVQTREILARSMSKIAEAVDADYEAVIYYEKSSRQPKRPRDATESDNIDYAKSADLTAWLGRNV